MIVAWAKVIVSLCRVILEFPRFARGTDIGQVTEGCLTTVFQYVCWLNAAICGVNTQKLLRFSNQDHNLVQLYVECLSFSPADKIQGQSFSPCYIHSCQFSIFSGDEEN